ncbi:helix-turn-helix transcriptional regulator [Bosea sp. TND4EK4]|uniref:helix-turn-helix transcriptional regulator n=1 Tax=Bosea sp. TND4EK4 TaxID=1907408 RepID=UPI0009704BA9|nr:helix-turn-helix transcriptional regulator [Bosea sp. TND4EK4]
MSLHASVLGREPAVPARGCRREQPLAGPASASRPVFVIDARLDIRFCNAAAQRLLACGFGHRDRFTADDKDFMARLQGWLKRCGTGSAPAEARWPASLRGRQVAVDAVRLPGLDLFMLSVDDPESTMMRNLAFVAEACGLTPTEERMLALIVEGLDTIVAARRMGIAPTTARTHLQRLFTKTGTARQSELVRFVATYVEELR